MSEAESLLAGPLPAQREGLDRGDVTASELVEASLERIRAHAGLVAVISTRDTAALAEAEAAASRIAAGRPRSLLDGIPVLLKDNIVQAGEPASCASRILEGYVSPFDAGVTERLQAAGAVIVGRTNMDEFAMGSSTERSVYGPAHNPWDPTRACGGSSGGSAAAVAAGLVPIALGSDTGGSIRQPASFCGVVGLKPTYGRISRWGLVAFASSLDQIGPFGRTVADCAATLELIGGHDPRDSTSVPEPMPDLRARLDGDIAGMTLGLPKQYFVEKGVDPGVLARVREAVAVLEGAGAKVVEVDLPDVVVDVSCSSGTYVRVLALDLGRALGCGGHLASLRRTAAGPFTIADAAELSALEDDREAARARVWRLDDPRTAERLAPYLSPRQKRT